MKPTDLRIATPTEGTPVKKLTPIMVVKEIEPCLPFWTDRLGFEVTVTVPHEDRVGFAMLNNAGVELMYQSQASVEADLGPASETTAHENLAQTLAGSTATLFIEVEALDPVITALAGADVVVPRRKTFYGMDEIFVRAPCGTLVGFAARVGEG
jgi:uncharacterized glyoxalase superfamily protein PhnB